MKKSTTAAVATSNRTRVYTQKQIAAAKVHEWMYMMGQMVGGGVETSAVTKNEMNSRWCGVLARISSRTLMLGVALKGKG